MSDTALQPLTAETAPVVARLARLRTQLAAWFWVDGLCRLLWLVLALCALDLALDWLFRMDRAQRAVMLVLLVGALGWIAWRRLIRPLSATISDDALALQVESRNKELGEGLISALQLARIDDPASRGMSPQLVRHAVQSGARTADRVRFAGVLDDREFRLNAVLLALALIALGGLAFGVATVPSLAIWFNRNILLGDRIWPQKTYLVIERIGKDGSVVFPRGEDWTQRVRVTEESEVIPEQVWIDFRRAGSRAPVATKKVGPRLFEATFASVIEPFEFRARGGDAETEWVRVELVEQPGVEQLKLTVMPPAYAGAASEELPPGRGPYYVLPGSRLKVEGAANKPLLRADLVYDGQLLVPPAPGQSPPTFPRAAAMMPQPGETRFAVVFPADMLAAGMYTFDLEDTLGLTARRPASFAIRRRVDHEPRVRVKLIGVGGMVVPGARIPFTCRVTDDFGLSGLLVRYRWKGDDVANPEGNGELPLAAPADGAKQEWNLQEAIELSTLKIPPGSGLTLVFAGSDNDDVLGPNTGTSPENLIRVVTEEELRTDLLRREKEQRQEFERLLKNQEDLITDCRALAADLAGAKVESFIQYHKRQKVVGQNVGAIAERLALIVVEVQNNRLEEDAGRLQTRLTKEIVEPMQQLAGSMIPEALTSLERARRQADQPAERAASLAEAIAQQTAAAARMREILEHMVKNEGFQEAVNLLYEIQKAQTDVHEQTNKERQDRIKRLLEGQP